jgi:Fe-S-cluster containining protein
MKRNYKCKKCGMCCSAISIQSPSQARRYFLEVILGWEMITHDEAFKKNPYLKKNGQIEKDDYFYKCNKFDEETKKCTDYINRPDVCRNYGREPAEIQLYYSAKCGFNINNKKENKK